MDFLFEELDAQDTELGRLVLRRRRSPGLGGAIVHEVTLDGEFLMSSHVNAAEVALATLGLESFAGGGRRGIGVLVGGLGLGHTAAAGLDTAVVGRMTVIELMAPVIAWHESGRVPLGVRLTTDPRCDIVHDDFFRFIERAEAGSWHAILLDIDHSPKFLLHPRNRAFYEGSGPEQLRARLTPDGVFALWSADPPPAVFLDRLGAAFASVTCHDIRFDVPQLDREDANTIVVARRARTVA